MWCVILIDILEGEATIMQFHDFCSAFTKYDSIKRFIDPLIQLYLFPGTVSDFSSLSNQYIVSEVIF